MHVYDPILLNKSRFCSHVKLVALTTFEIDSIARRLEQTNTKQRRDHRVDEFLVITDMMYAMRRPFVVYVHTIYHSANGMANKVVSYATDCLSLMHVRNTKSV